MQNIHKLKEPKTTINKQILLRTFTKQKLYFEPYVIVEIMDIKCRLLSKNLFKRTQEHDGCTKPLAKDKFE